MIYAILFNPKHRTLVEVRSATQRGAQLPAFSEFLLFHMTDPAGELISQFNLERWWARHDVHPTARGRASRYLRFHSGGGVPVGVRGQGYGAALYMGGALAAYAHGYAGIGSITGVARSILADRLWASLVRIGLAEHHGHINLLPARAVLKTGLVVAYTGHQQTFVPTPAELVLRTRIRSRKEARRVLDVLQHAYPREVTDAFLSRADVRRRLGLPPLPAPPGGLEAAPIDLFGELPPLGPRARAILEQYGDLP